MSKAPRKPLDRNLLSPSTGFTEGDGQPQLVICVHRRAKPHRACGNDRDLLDLFTARAAERGQPISLTVVHCFGRCQRGPIVRLRGGAFFEGVSASDVDRILDAALAPRPSVAGY